MNNTSGNFYHMVTFGCQMNKYDAEKIEGVLCRVGMHPTSDPAIADLILVNTCSIREKAENKVLSYIGRLGKLKEGKDGLLIALGGCMATLHKQKIFGKAPAIDIIFGPDSIEKLPAMLRNRKKTGERQIDVEIAPTTVSWDVPDSNIRGGAVSAWVGIMKGCDNHCTYCVVPSTRGPEVSRDIRSIMDEVEDLAAKGFKEINLLGQNVNSYGKGLSYSMNFPALLTMVDKVKGIERIRFMTSHPKDLTDELIHTMAETEKVCPSFHLPLQAGSDRILREMNRGYTAKEYLEKVRRLKAAVDGITISTDIMVGFPGETDEDFRRTLEMVEEVRFDSMYLYNYSRRPGTSASEYSSQLSRGAKQERFDIILDMHKRIIGEKNLDMTGKTVEVLCEGTYNEGKGERERYFGRTPGNSMVVFGSEKDISGRLVDVKIASCGGYNLFGEMAVNLE